MGIPRHVQKELGRPTSVAQYTGTERKYRVTRVLIFFLKQMAI